MSGGFAASDLGIAGSVEGDQSVLVGSDIARLTDQTPLKLLNDGTGVRTTRDGQHDLSITLRDGSNITVDLGDSLTFDTALDLLNHGQGVRLGTIKITDRAGKQYLVDLSNAETLTDVNDAIRTATSDTVGISISGAHLMITDSSDGDGALKIEDYEGSFTATDLGIASEGEPGKGTMAGEDVFFFLSTLGDVIRGIENAAPDGALTVQIASDGKRLELIDHTAGTGALEISSLSDSNTAEDLGIAGTYMWDSFTGSRVIGGLNTVLVTSLNGGTGGSGITLGTITIQDRAGGTATLDLSGAETLDDILAAINDSDAIDVRAELNDTARGIVVRDLTGSTALNFQIAGAAAESLGIAVSGAVDYVDSGSNQLQYISENTLLSDLRAGEGISAGTFTITDSAHNQDRITVSGTDTMTVGDLLDTINRSSILQVRAAINGTGDGIVLIDEAGGADNLRVQESYSGTTAKDMGLVGVAATAGAGMIDGSFEYHLEVAGTDTLQSVVDKLNDLSAPIQASIISEGTDVGAYRLTVASTNTGKDGRLVFDGGDTKLAMFDMVKGQDAVIAFGGSGAGSSLVASSSSNEFTGMLSGVAINVHQASDTPVTVTVTQDVDAVVEGVQDFVTKFNEVLDLVDEYTSYDPETEMAGPLLGNHTVELVRTRLYNGVRSVLTGVGDFTRISQLGISIGSGAKLEFDEEKFREVYSENAAAVEEFFSTFDQEGYTAAASEGTGALDEFYATTEMGLGHVLDRLLDQLTNSDGMLTKSSDNYDDRKQLLTKRIEYLQDLLDKKEQRLYRQFYQMEMALSKLQDMQTALLNYTPMTTNTNTSGSMF